MQTDNQALIETIKADENHTDFIIIAMHKTGSGFCFAEIKEDKGDVPLKAFLYDAMMHNEEFYEFFRTAVESVKNAKIKSNPNIN